MTLFLMARRCKPADILKLDEKHDVSFPILWSKCFRSSGCAARRVAKKLQKSFFVDGSAQRPPSANLEAVNLDEEQKKALEKKAGHPIQSRRSSQLLLYPKFLEV